MCVALEYRQFARECIERDHVATSDEVRQQYLDIAKLWLMAASHMEGSVVIWPAGFLDGHAPRTQMNAKQVSPTDEFRKNAVKLQLLANTSNNSEDQVIWTGLAEHWARLALEANLNTGAFAAAGRQL